MNEQLTVQGTGQVVIEGEVDGIIYRNSLNGYTVFSLLSSDGDEITCVATMPQVSEGEIMRLTGLFTNHPVYGRQFNAEFYEHRMPETTQGIEKYLGSGLIKGVGPKMAKRIVDTFGNDTIRVLENAPERLASIRGISFEKAVSIGTVFAEQAARRHVMLFLQEYGISPTVGQRIYKKYKEATVETVKVNPYALADDISGIGFKTADSIAMRLGIAADSPDRVKSGIRFILVQASNDGHVYLPKEILVLHAAELMEIPTELAEDILLTMQFENMIWQETVDGERLVYLNGFYFAESYTAKKLVDLKNSFEHSPYDFLPEIEAVERSTGITLARNQRKAVSEAMANGVLVITGGPGTGKTTTINTVIKLLLKKNAKIELAAPTGRAAKRMTAATGMDAKTIHRLLGVSFSDENSLVQTFERDADNPIECDVLIIDESSMVDILLMFNLLKAVAPGTRLILVGDIDQLPSVGPGNVLKDIIRSGIIEVVCLDEIFRQAQESAIVMNAHRINRGEQPLLNEKGKDFFYVRRASIEGVTDTLIELVTKRLPVYAGCSRLDIAVLTPMRKSPLGANSLNQVLQRTLNPPSPEKDEREMRVNTFRVGDKVMQIRNNYNIVWKAFSGGGQLEEEGTGVYNGDEGIITRINNIEETLHVRFDDGRVVEYDFTRTDELELAYAVTIHKSQGSEYDVVVIPIHSGPWMLMSRNLLYTAVTRARKLAVIVGLSETVNRMVENDREVRRYSSLCYRMEKMDRLVSG